MTQQITPVILCGGAGTRLWPASRESFPKQFLTFGDTASGGARSLLQQTLLRACGPSFARPVVITGNDMRFLVAEQIRALGIEADILIEPARRNSTAAIMAGAFHAAARDPGATLLVLASDHMIADADAFRAAAEAALPAAKAGRLVVFGITPTAPETGYGYIEPGETLAQLAPALGVRRFVEKPDRASAEAYLAAGYLWNSGNFLFTAEAIIAACRTHAPDIAFAVQAAVRDGRSDLDFLRLEPAHFSAARSISIDYAIMEKAAGLAVLPVSYGWSDVGSWQAAWELAEKDAAGNAGFGDARFFNASNSYAYTTGPLTVVSGVEDVVVVATRDAVMVTRRQDAQSVKDVVAALAAEKRIEATEHLQNFRPWGNYMQIDRGSRYQVKRITVKPGGILSLQSHLHRSEHWVVVHGTARVTIDDTVRLVGENQSIYVPLGARHRMENPGHVPLELIEVQSGSYLGEDDITRYEDLYGR